MKNNLSKRFLICLSFIVSVSNATTISAQKATATKSGKVTSRPESASNVVGATARTPSSTVQNKPNRALNGNPESSYISPTKSPFERKSPSPKPSSEPNIPLPSAIDGNAYEIKKNYASAMSCSVSDIWYPRWLYHARQGMRQNRHCGCRGEITFLNETADTVDIYLGYLSSLETPTLEDAVLPPLKSRMMYPAFYIVPGDSATITGNCRGGLQYEAETRNSLWVKENYLTPRFVKNGSLRLSCIDQTVVLSE